MNSFYNLVFIGGIGTPFNVRYADYGYLSLTIRNITYISIIFLQKTTPVNITGFNQGTIIFVRKELFKLITISDACWYAA